MSRPCARETRGQRMKLKKAGPGTQGSRGALGGAMPRQKVKQSIGSLFWSPGFTDRILRLPGLPRDRRKASSAKLRRQWTADSARGFPAALPRAHARGEHWIISELEAFRRPPAIGSAPIAYSIASVSPWINAACASSARARYRSSPCHTRKRMRSSISRPRASAQPVDAVDRCLRETFGDEFVDRRVGELHDEPSIRLDAEVRHRLDLLPRRPRARV